MTVNNDEELIRKIRRNDYLSFNHLFEKYYSCLCKFVFDMIKDKLASEDLVQELFIKLWNNRRSLTIDQNVAAYLYRASRNSALNYIRNEKNRTKIIGEIIINNQAQFYEPMVEKEFLMIVEECINNLPERSREVFKMSRFEELTQKEISERLNISVKTIKNQIWKSLFYIRSCLKLKDAI
ncbi:MULTISPECIES: RNA polymerase sigma factor [Draconibacterium]|uniref:RNA polymerase sigma factor n=1 Tax=Draconibacterium TaxID=1471399 RepID=UPI0013D3198E|nr:MULTISPECIES: RNA polymerase sigma-70 factor [Draconibacterium]